MGRAFEYRKARKMKRWSSMAKVFTRITKDIIMAVKESGPSPDANSRLKALMQNARDANMPKENVERAIKRASSKDQADYKEMVYEGYGPIRHCRVSRDCGQIIRRVQLEMSVHISTSATVALARVVAWSSSLIASAFSKWQKARRTWRSSNLK